MNPAARSLTFTRKGALAVLQGMHPADAVRVMREYAALNFAGLDGGCELQDACDTLEEELCPSDPDVRLIEINQRFGACSWVA